jgi:hypothetical protein
LSALLSVKHFNRTHDNLSWKQHIATCQNLTSTYEIPIQFNGDSSMAWSIILSSGTCKRLIDNDLFMIPNKYKNGFLIFKKSFYNIDDISFEDINKSIIENTFVKNATYDKKPLKYFDIYGSNNMGDQDTGIIKFQTSNKNSFLIKTGPNITNQVIKLIDLNGSIMLTENLDKSYNWKIYSFSDKLPQNFTVEITDNGTGWGEWSAVAFKKDNNDIK